MSNSGNELPTDEDGVPINPLEKLKREAEKKRKRQEKEVVHCPECDTEILKNTIEDAVATAENHDNRQHDGEATTKVNGMVLPSDDVVESVEHALRTMEENDG